jgi:hypothetical protein
MKAIINTLLFLFVLLVLCSGCSKVQKNVHDYYPQVATTSAVVQADGSVLVKGTILSEGADPLSFVGFCMDTLPVPDMASNQKLVDTIYSNTFTASYPNLKAFKKYYFRTFAANRNGYSYGDVIAVGNVQIDSNTIDCKPALDSMKIVGNHREDSMKIYSATSPVYSTADGWVINVNAYEYGMILYFHDYPTQGTYLITNLSPDYSPYVRINVSSPLTFDTYLNSGTKLYVRSIDATHFEISFCDAVLPAGVDYSISARFRCAN